jgi:hypothetical protein
MANIDEQPKVSREILNTWLSPVQADNAAWEVKQVGKAWMTLAIVHFVISLFLNLLPGLPLTLSGLPWQHLTYGPALFVLGYLYARIRSLSLIIALILPVLIIAEAYFFYTDQSEKLSADLSYWQIGVAVAFRLLLLWLSLRGIRAALLNTRR